MEKHEAHLKEDTLVFSSQPICLQTLTTYFCPRGGLEPFPASSVCMHTNFPCFSKTIFTKPLRLDICLLREALFTESFLPKAGRGLKTEHQAQVETSALSNLFLVGMTLVLYRLHRAILAQSVRLDCHRIFHQHLTSQMQITQQW